MVSDGATVPWRTPTSFSQNLWFIATVKVDVLNGSFRCTAWDLRHPGQVKPGKLSESGLQQQRTSRFFLKLGPSGLELWAVRLCGFKYLSET